jgi:hypothetical protein
MACAVLLGVITNTEPRFEASIRARAAPYHRALRTGVCGLFVGAAGSISLKGGDASAIALRTFPEPV